MPKTTVQKVIFGLLMSFFMVLAMEMYNTGLRNGGLTNAGILNALRELPLMFALCFLTSTVVGEPLAARLAARLAVPRELSLIHICARGLAFCRRSGPVRHDGVRHVSGHEPMGYGDLPAAGDRVGALLAPDGGLQFSHGVFLADLFLRSAGAAAVPAAGALRGACPRLCGRGGGMRDMCKRSRTLVRPGPLAIIPPGAFLNR